MKQCWGIHLRIYKKDKQYKISQILRMKKCKLAETLTLHKILVTK